MKTIFSITLISLFLLSGCIKDDIVFDTIEPEVRLTSTVDTIAQGEEFQLVAMFTNNIGQVESATFLWESSDESILSVDQMGVINALTLGEATINVSVEVDGIFYSDEKEVVVGMNTVVTTTERSGSIAATSFYDLSGDFTMKKEDENIVIEFADNYIADQGLPGLYVYLTNNPATISGALEIGAVDVFEGAHQYVIPGNLEINGYSHILYFCKPFNVKVGDGEIQ